VTVGTPAGVRSEVVTTDAHGFRISHHGDTTVDATGWDALDRRGLLLGGSVSFGVGATSDRATLSSLLASATDVPFLNAGLRGANSTQELIGAIPFVRDADVVVLVTGVNNAAAALQSLGRNELVGPFFWEGAVEQLGRWTLDELVELTYGGAGSLGAKVARALRLVRGSARATGALASAEAGARRESHAPTAFAAAADRHARDLAILAGALRPGAKLLFAVQPLADACQRATTPEEEELFAWADTATGGRWQRTRATLAAGWPGYVARLRDACAELDVPFLDLGTLSYDGWCFTDRVHLTDRGYALAATALAEAL
jgi:hypothetical protein